MGGGDLFRRESNKNCVKGKEIKMDSEEGKPIETSKVQMGSQME